LNITAYLIEVLNLIEFNTTAIDLLKFKLYSFKDNWTYESEAARIVTDGYIF
jgi:hypothetical protein